MRDLKREKKTASIFMEYKNFILFNKDIFLEFKV